MVYILAFFSCLSVYLCAYGMEEAIEQATETTPLRSVVRNDGRRSVPTNSISLNSALSDDCKKALLTLILQVLAQENLPAEYSNVFKSVGEKQQILNKQAAGYKDLTKLKQTIDEFLSSPLDELADILLNAELRALFERLVSAHIRDASRSLEPSPVRNASLVLQTSLEAGNIQEIEGSFTLETLRPALLRLQRPEKILLAMFLTLEQRFMSQYCVFLKKRSLLTTEILAPAILLGTILFGLLAPAAKYLAVSPALKAIEGSNPSELLSWSIATGLSLFIMMLPAYYFYRTERNSNCRDLLNLLRKQRETIEEALKILHGNNLQVRA